QWNRNDDDKERNPSGVLEDGRSERASPGKKNHPSPYDRNSSPHSGTRAKNIPSHRAKSSEKEEHSSRYKEGGERRGGKMAQGWNSKASMIPLVGG
ncbi:hypothetical protein Tco_0158544, partial [Tanacetum coccineum]